MEDFECHPLVLIKQARLKSFKDLHSKWHYMVLINTDAINMCDTHDSIGNYVILYVSDTVMCMVLNDIRMWL